MVMIHTLKQDNKRHLLMLFIPGAFTLQPGLFLPAGNGPMETVLKLSEILSETFTLFFTSEVYVALVWPYPTDRAINIKNLEVTQGPSCQPRDELISHKSQILQQSSLNKRVLESHAELLF